MELKQDNKYIAVQNVNEYNNNAEEILNSEYGIICNDYKHRIKVNDRETQQSYICDNEGIMEREDHEEANNDNKNVEKTEINKNNGFKMQFIIIIQWYVRTIIFNWKHSINSRNIHYFGKSIFWNCLIDSIVWNLGVFICWYSIQISLKRATFLQKFFKL